MNSILVLAAVVTAGVLAAFLFFLVRLSRGARVKPVDAGWLASYTSARYRPMERLLAGEDLEFLSTQPGYTTDLGRRFKAERRRLFRLYLASLERDFERLHRAARVLLLSAPEDRPEFASALVRQQILFERAMMLVRWRLVLNRVGGAKVEVSGLIGVLEGMNAQVRSLAVVPAAA